MPTINKNTATNKNTINVKVVVGDVKKKKPRRRAPSSGAPSDLPPPPTVVQNYIQPSGLQPPAQTQANSYPEPTLPRTGASMMNRPYDVADVGVGMENEAVPEGLASNYDAYQANRQRYFMSLQEQMEELMQSDSNDMTQPPPDAADMPEHGAQEDSMVPMPIAVPDSIEYPDDPETLPVQHRSRAFALPPTSSPLALPSPEPPTQQTSSPSPSASPSPSKRLRGSRGGGKGRSRSASSQRRSMIDDGVINGRQKATKNRREAYEKWINTGRHAGSKPTFANDGA